LITITRRLAQQFRAVVRRAFGQVRSGPTVGFIAGAGGLTVKCMYADAAVELRVPGPRASETLWLPLAALEDFEAKKDDAVELTAANNNRVSANWRDGNVPQIAEYDSLQPSDVDKFPVSRTDFGANPPGLLQALHEASDVTGPNNPRFAVGCLQLTPEGEIHGTDGHQALIQTGFTFPWSAPILVPHNKVFHSPELSQDKPVAVAQSGDWLVVGVEPWAIYLRINKDGRFPSMQRIMPDPANATSRCQLSQDDARFLADTLPRLPSSDEQNSPVTLDVNGHIAIRARAPDQGKPTEVVLTNSTCSGDSVCISMNRTYLKRAMRLGLRELCLYGADAALLGHSENRKLVWMPLEHGGAIGPVEGSVLIESPKAQASTSPPPKPKIERKVQSVSDPIANSNGHAQANGHAPKTNGQARKPKASLHDIGMLIEQAIKLRTALHDRAHEAAELVKALKAHGRQSRAVQQTLEQIRTLKTLGV